MRKLFSKILDIKNRFYSWILFLFASILIILPAALWIKEGGTGIGAWGLSGISRDHKIIVDLLTSMFSISLICVSVLVFFILIFRMRINKTRLLLLTSISISLVIFSIPVFQYIIPVSWMEYYLLSSETHLTYNIGGKPNFLIDSNDITSSLWGYLQYILNPIRMINSTSYIELISVIKIFMISLSLYVSNFLVIKNVFKINNFLNKKDLSSMNFIMLLLALAVMIMFFYEVLSARELNQHSFLNRITGSYKFLIYIIQLTPFVLIQLYWSRKIRNSEFISSVFSVIMIPAMFSSLYLDFSLLYIRYDYLPSMLVAFLPSYIDMGILLGIMFFPLTSFILIILLFKQIKEYFVRKRSKDREIDCNRRSFITSIFERLKK